MKRSFLKPQAPTENVFVGDGRQRPPSKVSFSQVSSGAKSAPFQVPTVQACSGVLDSGTSRSDAEALIADDPELQKRIRMLEACLRVHSLSGPGLEGSLDSVTKVMVPPPVRRAPISVENTLTENMITVLGDDGDVPVVSRSSLRLADRRPIGTGSRAVCGGRPVCTDPPSASPGHISGSVARHGGCEPDAADCVADGGAGESVGRRAVRAGKAGCSFLADSVVSGNHVGHMHHNSRIHGSQSSSLACPRATVDLLHYACDARVLVSAGSAARCSAGLPAARSRSYADVAATACGWL